MACESNSGERRPVEQLPGSPPVFNRGRDGSVQATPMQPPVHVPAPPGSFAGPGNPPASPRLAAVQQRVVVVKDPGVAAILSFFWTGAGQIYNGQIGLGLLLMVFQIINFFLIFVGIGLLLLPAVWLFGIFNAHGESRRVNERHGVIS